MRIRTWHRHPRADVELTTWGSVTVTVSDGVRSYSSQHGTLNPFAHAVLTGFPTKNGVCTIRFRETRSITASNTALVDGRKTANGHSTSQAPGRRNSGCRTSAPASARH